MRFNLATVIIILALISYNLGGLFLTFTSPQTIYLSPGKELINSNKLEVFSTISLLVTTITLLFLIMLRKRGLKNEKSK